MFTLACTGVFWFQVNISAIRRFSVSLRQIQEVYNETRVFAYTHAYRRFSAIRAASAVDYQLPPTGSRLVGQNQTYTVQEGDKNLQAIARRFDTAAMLILEANNTIAPVPKLWYDDNYSFTTVIT